MIRRFLIPLVGLVLASAAFVHAGSESGLLLSSNNALLSSGMTATAVSKAVDREFRGELARSASQELTEIGPVAKPLADLALRAFLANPLEVSTIRTIVLGSVLQADVERARRAMHLAARISKRDAMTNIWLAQDYGRRGDMAGLMTWFDHALRTSRRTRESAIGPLVNLLADPNSYAPLGELLRQEPVWKAAFWAEFARNPTALQVAGDFFHATSLALDGIEPATRARLYANLRSAGELETLFQLAALDPLTDAQASSLAMGVFETTAAANPLAWMFRSEGNFATLVQSNSSELQIDARAGSFGVAAERIVRFGGAFVLELNAAEPLPAGAEVRLIARCANDGRIMSAIYLSHGDVTGQEQFESNECGFGTLQLSFNVEPGRRDVLIRIKSISLRAV